MNREIVDFLLNIFLFSVAVTVAVMFLGLVFMLFGSELPHYSFEDDGEQEELNHD